MGQERPFEGRIRPLRAGFLVSLAAVASAVSASGKMAVMRCCSP